MSKHRKPAPANGAATAKEATKREVPKHRQCPSCYGGRGGVGQERWHRRKGTIMRICYQCDTCGFDWTANVRKVTESLSIEYQEVDVEFGAVQIDVER